jgi:hypothetical protein
VLIIAIAMDKDAAAANKLATEHGWTKSFALVACSGKGAQDPVFDKFMVSKTPYQVLIGADGAVIDEGRHIKDVAKMLE